MNWALITSIADVVGAIAVVISLVYLSVQVRTNTKASKANAFQTAIRSEIDLASIIIEHAGVWDKVVTGAPLAKGEETRTAILLYNMLMLDTAHRYRQYTDGYLDAQAWETRRETLPSIVSFTIFGVWRTSLGARGLPSDFMRLVDEVVSDLDGQGSGGDD